MGHTSVLPLPSLSRPTLNTCVKKTRRLLLGADFSRAEGGNPLLPRSHLGAVGSLEFHFARLQGRQAAQEAIFLEAGDEGHLRLGPLQSRDAVSAANCLRRHNKIIHAKSRYFTFMQVN